MGSDAFRSVASARLLVGVTFGVVLAFVASTAISQAIENGSAHATDEIIGNAMPSVQLLSLVRGDLRGIDRELRDRATRTPEDLARHIAQRRRNTDAAFASYTALPFFAGERDLYAPLPGMLQRLDARLRSVQPTSTDAQIDVVDDSIDEIDRTVERIETFDAAQGQRLGLAIERNRSDSRTLIVMLDTATALLAVGAVLLAVRARRRALRSLIAETAVAEQSLADLRTQVDELAHFAGRVAHDLRNPLHTALLTLDLVRLQAPAASTAIARGTSALRRMEGLVEDLLGFARAGGKPKAGTTVDLGAAVREVIDGLAGDAADAQIELAAETIDGAVVAGTPGVMISIVSNLTRNAIRHMGESLERSIHVRVIDAGTRWRLEVQDTGPGIPPGQERRIFEPHVQLDAAGGGIGLGLATVDRLVKAHGGALGVISPPGCGALFWVELPKAAV